MVRIWILLISPSELRDTYKLMIKDCGTKDIQYIGNVYNVFLCMIHVAILNFESIVLHETSFYCQYCFCFIITPILIYHYR
jgi:hypothetical protein